MTWMQVVGATIAFLGVYLQFAAWIGRTLRDAEEDE